MKSVVNYSVEYLCVNNAKFLISKRYNSKTKSDTTNYDALLFLNSYSKFQKKKKIKKFMQAVKCMYSFFPHTDFIIVY